MAATAIAAVLRPLKKWQQPEDCAVFARVSRDMVKVELRGGKVFSVDRFRLYERRVVGKVPERIADRELDALPWEGTGPDPLARFDANRGSRPSGMLA